MSNIGELREMSDEQLAATLKEACTTLFKLRVQAQTERLDVPSEVKRNRRTVARIKTLQTERIAAKAAAAQPAQSAETAGATAEG